MKSKWLYKDKSRGRKLIVFCNGWGMDAQPFRPLGSFEWDVLMFFGYVDLEPDLDLQLLFTSYEEIVLLAWSMGVWAGQQLFAPFRQELRAAVAVNGTPCPIHNQFGIPQAIARSTCEQLNMKSRLKFYHRMCRDRGLYEKFLTHQPARDVSDQKRELEQLLNMVECRVAEEPIYDRVLVAKSDYIIPTANQLNFWDENLVSQVDGYHFLFYGYGSWDELIDIRYAV